MDYPDVAYAAKGVADADREPLWHHDPEPRHWSDCYSFPDSKPGGDDFAERTDVEADDQSSLVGGVRDDDDLSGAPPSQPAENTSAGLADEPLWFQKRWNDHWVVPNVFLRGSLFAGVRATHRTLNNALMASQSDFTVIATGAQLTQSDLDVWCAVVNLENGKRVDVSCHKLLRHLDRHDGSSDRAWLLSALQRLHRCHVVITFKDDRRRGYTGTLIRDLRSRAPASKKPPAQGRNRRETNNQIELLIDPAIAHLFDAGWTQLSTSWRRRMRMKPLANWLTAFYLTHREPMRIKVDTLRRFSGSTGRSSTFKKQLDEALCFVKAAGYFPVATTVGDLVEIVRGPVASDAHPNVGDPPEQTLPLPSASIPTAAPVTVGRKAASSLARRVRRMMIAVRAYLARW